jgi:hypothetical protein
MTLLKEELETLLVPGPRRDEALEKVAQAGAEYIEMMLRRPISRINLTLVLYPRRCIVVERTDGRRCWLSVGKRQPLDVGASGWANVAKTSTAKTTCDEMPLVFRPTDEDTVTCLTCLVHGPFEYKVV